MTRNLTHDTRWMRRSACTIDDAPLLTANRTDQQSTAAAICLDCPVRSDCLAYALQNNIDTDVWGGLTADERGPLHASRSGEVKDLSCRIAELRESGLTTREIALALGVTDRTVQRHQNNAT